MTDVPNDRTEYSLLPSDAHACNYLPRLCSCKKLFNTSSTRVSKKGEQNNLKNRVGH